MASRRKTKNQAPGGATRPVGLFLAAGFIVAAATQANVQAIHRKDVVKLAFERGRYEVEDDLVARRGSVVSADGRILAQNDDVYEFQLFYNKLPRSPGFYAELSQATGISMEELRAPALVGQDRRTWATPLGGDEARAVRAITRKWNADGVSLAKVMHRRYPLGWTASGIVGLVRPDGAVNGLERSLDGQLAGQNGEAKGFIDRTGAFMSIDDKDLRQLVQGKDVTLTLDSVLQFEAGQAVKHAVELNKAESGAIVVIEPSTGNILAMSNYPTFDPEGKIGDGEDLNVAYRGMFEPGSTFKIMTLAKALDLGDVGYTDHLQCSGALRISTKTIHCSHGAHGDVDWEKAIAESCNVAAATWAGKIGSDGMHGYIKQLGLLDKPSLGLPWETGGMYNENDPAKAIQLATNGFGQSMNATPVALASAFSCLANGGLRMKPRLIAKIGDEETKVEAAGQIVKPEVADFVKNLMVSTIQKDFGTGKGLRIPGYTLAGKTGTAQRLQGSSQKGWVSNFVGIVPAENPKALVLVMINDPKAGSYYGASVAGPVFVEMAKTLIRRYGIAPDGGTATPSPAR